MFQPLPTPYSSSFASYGVQRQQNSGHDDYQYQSPNLPPGLGSGGPIVFDSPVFAQVGFGALTPLPPLNLNQPRYSGAMDTHSNDDLAAQEALARQYQPELKGPLVGNKTSSQAIAEEYAKADPIYIAKTSTLPQIYSHYRQVRGDGNCGWRAIAFCYFETLLKLGNKERIDTECARMVSLADFIVTWRGLAEWVFVDMRDEVLGLLREIGEIIHLGPQPDSSSLILQRFNDQSASNSIIYYFRLLASAWLKANAATYQDFIPDVRGVDDYIKDILEPFSAEIEHLGMTLLVDILVKPINISVEIVYLDRSEGTTVNSHIMESQNATQNAIVHLLYRPGHYDILYKEANRSPPRSAKQQAIIANTSANTNLQVNRATGFTQQHRIQGTAMGDFPGSDMSVLMDMPQLFGLSSIPSFAEPFTSVPAFNPAPAPSFTMDSPVPSLSPDPGVFPTVPLTIPIHPNPPLIQTHAAPHMNGLPSDLSPASSSGSQFRPSKYEYEPDWSDGQAQTFQTSTFKNSHYNIAHYNNPNFQPEEWSPDCEEAVGKGRGR